jgi:hypothetical protein
MRTSNDAVLRRARSALTATLMLMLAPAASAEISVAILDFELNDITGLRAPEEQKRTASLAPLLRDAMSQMNGYDVTAIEPEAQVRANAGVGYLFNQPEAVAALAEASGAKMGRSWNVAEIELSVRLRHRTGFESHDKATDRRVQHQARRTHDRPQDHRSRHAADRGPGRCRDQGRIAQPSSEPNSGSE